MTTTAISPDLTAVQTAKIQAKDMNTLTTNDFLKLLITELMQQDPFEPMKNQELLNQISSIRQLEMNTQLNETLEGLTLQGNLGSAAGLIGKAITGLNLAQYMVSGSVSGVLVRDGEIVLELDNGDGVRLADVIYVTAPEAGLAEADPAEADEIPADEVPADEVPADEAPAADEEG